ncbi:MAG: dUTP diphosphatase [Oscillospiraceae bacterium]|nr:dUTP diphosphatase [Oscillospiraceae bacterium]
MELKIKALSPKVGNEIPFPSYATAGSAGMDLRACIDESVTVQPGEQALIPAGFAIALPSKDYVALIYARSGLAVKHGLSPANCVGVIDSDYRGPIVVALRNYGKEPYTIEPGERVAQMVITPVVQAAISVVDELDDTDRGAGGFGSTGRV